MKTSIGKALRIMVPQQQLNQVHKPLTVPELTTSERKPPWGVGVLKEVQRLPSIIL